MSCEGVSLGGTGMNGVPSVQSLLSVSEADGSGKN